MIASPACKKLLTLFSKRTPYKASAGYRESSPYRRLPCSGKLSQRYAVCEGQFQRVDSRLKLIFTNTFRYVVVVISSVLVLAQLGVQMKRIIAVLGAAVFANSLVIQRAL